MYKDYIGTLGSLDVRRFEKVIGMYDELRPLNYFIVKKRIEEAKNVTDVGRASMLQHNEYIFESLFTTLGYVKTHKGVSIGDTVYIDGRKYPSVVHEFVLRGTEVFVILDDYKTALGNMVI